jgi:hypothetical protein
LEVGFDMKYRERFWECLFNPAEEQLLERDPLLAFSFYLSGRVLVLCDLADEIVSNLDQGFSVEPINGGVIGRADMLIWFWLLGAYEGVRTMHQAKQCFSERLATDLQDLNKRLARARMPAAKMEKPGRRAPVSTNRSPSGWDYNNGDLLVNDPEERESISARGLLAHFDQVFCSISRADVIRHHSTSYFDERDHSAEAEE